MTIYVTEKARTLEPSGFGIKRLVSVYAVVSDKTEDASASAKHFTPSKWKELLAGADVMHRYQKEPYRSISAA